jgi:Arc/MetJ family transcription regulator
MGSIAVVKTTIDIDDALLARAKRHARKVGQPLRALVEEGLRRVFEGDSVTTQYEIPDRSVGNPAGPNPLDDLSWQDLRHEIYGGR